ncbi:MAG TPA: hypothetical protein VJN41_02330 [Alphaproteobacteria bacterium]|nr:hypothetical protein [Alphaproteobacteria bacterium]
MKLRHVLAIVYAGAALAIAASADANWLTRLGRGAAEIGAEGGKAGKLGLGALDSAAGYIGKLPAAADGVPLAAHATSEGHWKFVNREGEVFTAGTPDEMRRAVPTLAPGAADGRSRLALYLSEDTVFGRRPLLKDLPKDADLHVVIGNDSYRLLGRAEGGAETLLAEVRANIVVELVDRRIFDEIVFQLARPLSKSSIRVLALEPGGPKTFSSSPLLDPATKAALVDRIDPGALPAALSKVKGQTVIVTGRVDGDALTFRPASGPERKILLKDLTRAAEAADVNAVILETAAPRQPGGRNWLWQRVAVKGLDEALERASFADFLDALGASRGELRISAAPEGPGRVRLRAVPSGESAAPLSGTVGDWLAGMVGTVTGDVVVQGVDAHARDAERQNEIDSRIIAGIPSAVQFGYLAGLVMGVMGLAVARGWWRSIWPPERSEEYRDRVGYQAARAARTAAFVLLFLPLAGGLAFVWTTAVQLRNFLTAPVRFIGWLKSRLSLRAG